MPADTPPPPILPRHHGRSLRTRLVAWLSVVLLGFATLAAAVWLRETRHAIDEEVRAAGHVAVQWLNVLIANERMPADPANVSGAAGVAGVPDALPGHSPLLAQLAAIGRLRAHHIDVFDATGARVYASPPSAYKTGRAAPAWFGAWLASPPAAHTFQTARHRVVLTADASRSVLDAWDQLIASMGWIAAAALASALLTQGLLRRALAPLGRLEQALAGCARGHIATALPDSGWREIDALTGRYNQLAAQLAQSRALNSRLSHAQALAEAVQVRLEEERKLIARELHDELGQGIAAVRAIAGAIQQRTLAQPHLHGSAQAILAMTGQMQDGVRTILQRLRPADAEHPSSMRPDANADADADTTSDGPAPLAERCAALLHRHCRQWAALHPHIALHGDFSASRPSPARQPRLDHAGADDARLAVGQWRSPGVAYTQDAPDSSDSPVPAALLRILQETLTNVARHAGATRVTVRLAEQAGELALDVADDGVGLPARSASPAGTGYGLRGMRERATELGGTLHLHAGANGGVTVSVRIPSDPPPQAAVRNDTALSRLACGSPPPTGGPSR